MKCGVALQAFGKVLGTPNERSPPHYPGLQAVAQPDVDQ